MENGRNVAEKQSSSVDSGNSSIHLRVFVDENVPDNKLMWYVIIHLTFVLSASVMGYLDRIRLS